MMNYYGRQNTQKPKTVHIKIEKVKKEILKNTERRKRLGGWVGGAQTGRINKITISNNKK